MTQNTQNGYICLPRGWMNMPSLRRGHDPFCRPTAWLWMVGQAYWCDGIASVFDKTVPIQRGQLTTTLNEMSKQWNWSIGAVRRFMQRLTEDEEIRTCSDSGHTIITICKYEEYSSHHQNMSTTPAQLRHNSGIPIEEKKERKSTPLPPTDLFAETQPSAAAGDQEGFIPGPKATGKMAPKPTAEPEGFEAFWAEYPKRTDRSGALRAYRKLIQDGATPEEILAGVRRTRFPEVRYVPQPKNWLTDRQWMPPPATAPKQYRYF